MFDANPERLVVAWDKYAELTVKALVQAGHSTGKPVDVVVWPESTFTGYSTRYHCGITWMEDKIEQQVPREMAEQKWDKLSISDMVGSLQQEFRNKVSVLHTAMTAAATQPTQDVAVNAAPPHLLVAMTSWSLRMKKLASITRFC